MKTIVSRWKPVLTFTALLLSVLMAFTGCSSSGGGGSDTSTPLAAGNIPTAINTSISVDEDSSFSGSLSVADSDSENLSFRIATSPTLGTVTFTDESAGTFTYTPNADQNGTDSFTFIVSDGTEDSNEATVEITINPVNDSPVAAGSSFTVNEDSTLSNTLSASDVDGDTLGFSVVASPGKGTVTITGSNTGAFTYTPNQNVTGQDSFTFKVSDGQTDSNTATVTIDIAAVNDVPVAANSSINVTEDTAANNTMVATDGDGDALAFSLVDLPGKGTVTITDNTTGAFTYTPNLNENGDDSFTFKVSDGKADSNTATVSVTIASVNDTPSVSVPADFSENEMTTVSLVGSGSDVEDPSVTYAWTQTAGTAVNLLNADSATAQFETPAVETVAPVPLTFKLTVTDSQGLSAEDSVTVTVNPVGHIIGAVASPAYHTILTEEGALDWAHFGFFTANSFVSKVGGSGELSNYTQIPVPGSITPSPSEDANPVSFSWSDGEPHNPVKETRNRVRFADAAVGEGIRLSIPAGVEDKILKVYLGAYSNKGKVTVRLSGDSAVTPYTVSLDNPDPIQKAWVVTVYFGAASDGGTLEFDYVVEETYGGHINIAAATLISAQAETPVFMPLSGTYTDPLSVTLTSSPAAATIRYTTDGSAPTSASTLYSGSISVTGNQTVNARAFYPGIADSAAVSSSYIVDTSAASTLAATISTVPYHTDLTDEGTLDWAHFGYFTAFSFVSKVGGSGDLSDYTQIGSVTPNRSTGNPVSFSWTDGEPHNPADQTRTRVFFTDTDEGEGIQLTIPADDVEKTLRVYIGAYSMEGQVSVYMEDSSTPIFTETVSSPDEVQQAWVVNVDFATQTGSLSNLIFKYVRGQDTGITGGHINIAAASLSD